MKIVIVLILLGLIWVGLYLLLRGRSVSAGNARDYPQRIHAELSEMFYHVSVRTITRGLVVLMVFGALVGFLLPGTISRVEQKMTIDRAMSYNQQQEYARAILQLERLRNIRSPLVHNELGVAFMGSRNYGQAEAEFNEAIRLLPQYGTAHMNLAELYIIMDRYVEASFAEARARDSANFIIHEDRLYNLSGSAADQLGMRILLAALLALGAALIPKGIISFFRWRRRKAFDAQLPDGLVMISNGLRAGLSLLQAIEMVVKDGKPPLSQEFELVLREHQLGSSLGDSLKNLATRMPGNDTRIMVNATLILLEAGGNLPERFDTLAQTIQERKKVQQKIQTMTAEGVTQAWILSLLPLIIAILLNTMNNEVFRLMYTTFFGWMISALALLMVATGIWWMHRIIKVKI